MGAIPSNPIDEAKQARIDEITKDSVAYFSKSFTLAYPSALVEVLKEEAQPDEGDGLLLPPVEPPGGEVKRGTVLKKMDWKKSWQRRTLVLKNAADNYILENWGEAGTAKKSEWQMCGCTVRSTKDETTGDFMIVLVPPGDGRLWELKCETEEEWNEWTSVLRNAAYKAEPPKNPDKVLAIAFKAAYKALRWHYGYWGWFSVNQTESGCLTTFIMEVINREVLWSAFDSIPAGATKSTLVSTINKSVRTAVSAAVSAGWNGVVTSMAAGRSTLEETAKGILTPIFEAEISIKERLTNAISGKMNPFAEGTLRTVCNPVIGLTSEPLAKAFRMAVKGMATVTFPRLIEKIGSNTEKKHVEDAVKETDSWLWYWSDRNPVEATMREIYYKMYQDVPSSLFNGWGSWESRQLALDKIRDLCRRATNAFALALLESEDKSPVAMEAIKVAVLVKFFEDTKTLLATTVKEILVGLLNEPLESGLLTPALELVGEVQEFIDQLPGMSTLFSITDLTESVIRDTVDSTVETLVSDKVREGCAEIDRIKSEVGI